MEGKKIMENAEEVEEGRRMAGDGWLVGGRGWSVGGWTGWMQVVDAGGRCRW